MFELLSIELTPEKAKIVKVSGISNLSIEKVEEYSFKEKVDFEDKESLKDIKDFLEGYFKDNKRYSSNVYFTISGCFSVLLREIDLPKLDTNKTFNALKYEIPKYFPVNMNRFIFDFKVIEYKDNMQKVLTFVVPKAVIEMISELEKLCNVRVKKVDIDANVFTRIPKKFKEFRNKNILVINLMDSSYTFTILRNNKIFIHKNFDYEDTYEGYDKFDDILNNLYRFIEFFQNKEKMKIDNFFIVSEGLEDYNNTLKSRIYQNLQVEVNEINLLNIAKIKGNIKEKEALKYSTAILGLL